MTTNQDALFLAMADHLAQYSKYSDEMCAIGRGLSISSPTGPDHLRSLIAGKLRSMTFGKRDVSAYVSNIARAYGVVTF